MRSDFRPSTVAGTKEAAALRDFDPADVRFGSKADLTPSSGHVRFAPEADINRRERHVRFVPKADSCTAAEAAYSITSSVSASS
jgi:hypothetical protein